MAEDKRRNLGRGLSALLGDKSAVSVVSSTIPAQAPNALKTLPIGAMKPGKFQPRRQFDEEAIADLVESVREKGILQPILVRPYQDYFEIIAGERRWRAAQRAQLHEVPVIIREMTDREALEVALVENLQRQDLSPLEEAEGYRRLVDEFSHTQEELAKSVGKSRSHVANMMRLLALPDAIKQMVEQKQISAGHARALLTAADPLDLARQVVDKHLNVRQTEKLVADAAKQKLAPAVKSVSPAKDADTAALERDLTASLGLKVTLNANGSSGQLTIHYSSLEQLDDILARLSGEGK